MDSQFFEDYLTGGVRISPPRTISAADIQRHAEETGDFHPIHLDAVFAATQEFKRPIAHGTLVFAIAVGQTAAQINREAFSYGYDRLRFIRPVFIGDILTARCTVREKRDDPKRPLHGFVVELVEAINQRGETVLAAEHLLLVRRRPLA